MKAQLFLFNIEGYGEFLSGITPISQKNDTFFQNSLKANFKCTLSTFKHMKENSWYKNRMKLLSMTNSFKC